MSDYIFNQNKEDYTKPTLFLGEQKGIFDTINKVYPEIWKLYKKLKSLDWDEEEFDFTSLNLEFKQVSANYKDIMIKTLAWQWEADSVAATSIIPILAPFITSTELWTTWCRVQENECLHANTYSEIVRSSFDDPNEVLNEVLAVKESLTRLNNVINVFSDTYKASLEYSESLVNNVSVNKEYYYNKVLTYVITLYILERVQFVASFAITFSLAEASIFVPIGKAVQKIAQDEFEIHCKLDKAILLYEKNTPLGNSIISKNKDIYKSILEEVIESEFNWTDYLFSEGRELIGVTPKLLKNWVLWCSKDIYEVLNITSSYELPDNNPLPFLDDWLTNSHQASPQEEKNTAYLLGAVVDTTGDEVLDFKL